MSRGVQAYQIFLFLVPRWSTLVCNYVTAEVCLACTGTEHGGSFCSTSDHPFRLSVEGTSIHRKQWVAIQSWLLGKYKIVDCYYIRMSQISSRNFGSFLFFNLREKHFSLLALPRLLSSVRTDNSLANITFCRDLLLFT